VIWLSLSLIHHVNLGDLLRLSHVDVVEDDFLVVGARLVPFDDYTIIKGLEHSDTLDRVWLVLEIRCVRLLHPLLVASNLVSLGFLGDKVIGSLLDFLYSGLPLFFVLREVFIIVSV